MTVVRTGLDRIAQGDALLRARLRDQRVGLLAHPASVDRQLRHATTLLHALGAQLVALFGPEHGWTGQAQDMVGVAQGSAPGADAPRMYSLYGERFEDLRPSAASLADLDLVVIDLQDVGSRYYTYVWTAALMLEAAAARGLTCLVLDRPNPLGGARLEGAPQRPGYRSFVGLHDVPVRHGMTLGEVLTRVRAQLDLDPASLEVVTMEGYRRDMLWRDTGLPWVLPSPNMPTVETATVYPGGCLLEGTNLSEGRGHTRPFEIWGAPFVDGEALAAKLELPGAALRPLEFEPTFHKHDGQTCRGVQVHVRDEARFEPYAAYMRLIQAVAQQAPEDFAWRTERYEFVDDIAAIDLLTGGPEFRDVVDGDGDLDGLIREDQRAAAEFARARVPHLLYR